MTLWETGGVMNTHTTKPVSIAHDAVPEFADSKTVRKMFGLSRSHAYRLSAEGKIKSSVLRQRGSLRGRRLWHVQSIRGYLLANMEGSPE
jgi:hypothetical protein